MKEREGDIETGRDREIGRDRINIIKTQEWKENKKIILGNGPLKINRNKR